MNSTYLQTILISGSIALMVFLFASRISGYVINLFRNLLSSISIRLRKTEPLGFWPKILSKDISRVRYIINWSGISVKNFNLIIFGLVFVLVSSLLSSNLIFFLLALTVGFLFLVWVYSKSQQQIKKLTQQIPSSMLVLTSSLRAGYSLEEAIRIAERETEKPVSEVFAALARAHVYNLPLSTALENLDKYILINDWELVSETIRIQQKVGGNIIPVIEELSRTLMDKASVEQEVLSATAAGRMSGLLLACLAPISFFILLFFAPGYISVLYTTAIGKFLLVIAGLLEVIGFVMILKIIKTDF